MTVISFSLFRMLNIELSWLKWGNTCSWECGSLLILLVLVLQLKRVLEVLVWLAFAKGAGGLQNNPSRFIWTLFRLRRLKLLLLCVVLPLALSLPPNILAVSLAEECLGQSRMGFPQVVAIDDEEIPEPPLLEPRADDIVQPKQFRRRHTTPPPRAKAVGMPPKKLDGSSLRRSSFSNPEPHTLPSRIPVARRSRSGGGAVSKAWKWFKWCRSGVKSLLGWAVLITLLAHGASGQFFEQITRMASAIARVSESASLAASTVIDRGTDLATTTSTAVLTFATGAANLVETAWQGVDLLNLHCEKTSGAVTAEHNLVLLEWLQSPAGLALMGGNLTEVSQLWQYLIQSVGLALPQLKIAKEFLSTSGLYWKIYGRCFIHSAGFVVLEFEMVQIHFTAQWANPFWEVLAVDIQTEYSQIHELVSNFSSQVDVAAPLHWHWAAQDLPHPGWCAKLWLWSIMVFRSMYLHLVSSRGYGFMAVGGLCFALWRCSRGSFDDWLQKGRALYLKLWSKIQGWDIIS